MNAARQAHLEEFYQLLAELAASEHGPRRLASCTGRDGWPRHGVYFFFEDDQTRADGSGRVVRVGTHALRPTDKTTLWDGCASTAGGPGDATRAAATTAHPSSVGMSAPRSSAESTCPRAAGLVGRQPAGRRMGTGRRPA